MNLREYVSSESANGAFRNSSDTFIRHEPCGSCGSSDGKAVYSSHTFCFVCKEYKNTEEESFTSSHSTSTNMNTYISYVGQPTRLKNRGLSEDTCKLFKILRDGNVLRFYYHDKSGRPIGAKTKTLSKEFKYEGQTEGTFFGQHLFPDKGKRVVVFEGELDAATGYQCMDGWPMVSLPSGAAAAKKSIQRNLEWLQGYDEVVLFFDNDEPGIKAATEAASVLPPGKVKIARMEGYKDASEALMADDAESVRKAIWNSKPYRPDGIIDAKNLMELVTTPSPPADFHYPFTGLNNKLHGIRYGELTTITAGSGIGKSSFCRDIATALLKKGERVGYLALEESNRRTALGLMSSAVGSSLHMGDHSQKELAGYFEETISKWNLFLFDGFGSYDPDIIYNRIEYLASGLDCKIIFLDHLSILLSGLDGDERRMIDVTMTRLRSLVERTGITLFLVSHLRRSQHDQGHEEGARVSLSQLRGSAAIAQLSDSVIALERNQQAEGSNFNDTTVRVIKNRYSGETGIACTLSYDLSTCKFIEQDHAEGFDTGGFTETTSFKKEFPNFKRIEDFTFT